MKKALLLGAMILTSYFLVGCEEMEINYEGQLMKESEVEERIADKLEVDNSDYDLEVDIYMESDD